MDNYTKTAIGVLVAGLWLWIGLISYAADLRVQTVPQGGTGFSSSSPNSIVVTGTTSTSALIATSSSPLYIGSLNATTTATSTMQGGLNVSISSGCLAVNGTCVSTAGGGITSLNGLTGATQTFADNDYVDILSSGTVHTFSGSTSPNIGTLTATSSIGTSGNRIPNLWVSTGDITTLTAGTIVINQFVSGNLEVTGDALIYGGDIFLGTGTATTTLTTSAANVLTITGGGYVAQASSTVVGVFRNDGGAYFMNGNVGIGTTNPTYKLEVGGTLRVDSTSSFGGKPTFVDGFIVGTNQAMYFATDLSSGIYTVNGVDFTLTTNAIRRITVAVSGNVGIGTTSPTNLLEVNGTSYTTNLIVSSGGFLNVPNGADPTLTRVGQLALNTTTASTSLRFYDGTAERVLNVTDEKSFVIASTTLVYIGSYGTAGTTTLKLAQFSRPTTVLNYFCSVVGDTSVTVAFGTGSATTSYVIANGAGRQAILSSNNTWTARQAFYGEFGTRIGDPAYVSCTLSVREDAD